MKTSFLANETIYLEGLFEEYRNNPALVTPSGIRTFGEIRERLRAVIFHLKEAGVRQNDSVALHAENGELHLYLFLAAWVMGFLYLPLDFKAPLGSLVEAAPLDVLITSGDVPPSVKIAVLRPARLLQSSSVVAQPESWPPIPFGREAGAVFTSGSTGKPRGIVHTVGNYIYSALGTNAFIGMEPTDRWLLSLPLFHVGGILIWVRTLLSGSASILPESLKRIEAAVLIHRPSVLSLVPTQLIRFLASDAIVRILQKAKTVMLGGAPSPAWLIEKALDLGIPVMPTYGSTEACAQVTGVARDADRKSYLTAGRPLAYRDVRIGEDGTILLGGKTLFSRYLHDPSGSHATADGFFRTADAGRIDPEGNLVVLGRKDGIFISGGENISPFEIENALLAMDSVATAIVVPVPHGEFGRVPWAFVEMSDPFDEAVLLAALKTRLPGYKVPKRILRLDPQDRRGKMKYSRATLTKRAGEMAGQEGGGGR
ncbi:AMP-binding protein [Syntrophus aciditrophicus]|uniref:O-succinylbenzoic acid--CoA ligase n=1 Tax=Syntrophus aciditrophicus (strain SB) TaxID=56780 RepID=Q2LX91_SYNAS|nr:AMP-binding protein [Syntrophus aciditrophicus]ABC78704.1 o-succinylbenzoic acid--CoA ligase [Syntrophus aciditrophicus SB]OPY15823.1 MAG: 2-succinylbenzoate--CoA ligase [Syntrophus sp. PtaB.Bin075]